MNHPTMTVDALESRTLFSGTPNPLVVADLAQLKTDVAKLQADQGANWTTLNNDKQAVDATLKALAGQLDTLKAQCKADESTWKTVLAADFAALKAAEDAARPVIAADLLKVAGDPDGSDARKADLAQLEADRAALKASMAPLRAKFADDTSAMKAALAADRDAVNNLLNSDPAYTAAKAKLAADQKAGEALLKADRATIKADEDRIKQDAKKGHDGDSKKGEAQKKSAKSHKS